MCHLMNRVLVMNALATAYHSNCNAAQLYSTDIPQQTIMCKLVCGCSAYTYRQRRLGPAHQSKPSLPRHQTGLHCWQQKPALPHSLTLLYTCVHTSIHKATSANGSSHTNSLVERCMSALKASCQVTLSPLRNPFMLSGSTSNLQLQCLASMLLQASMSLSTMHRCEPNTVLSSSFTIRHHQNQKILTPKQALQ